MSYEPQNTRCCDIYAMSICVPQQGRHPDPAHGDVQQAHGEAPLRPAGHLGGLEGQGHRGRGSIRERERPTPTLQPWASHELQLAGWHGQR